MRKLKLEVETLAVESFPTLPPEAAERGTVHGADNHTREIYCTKGDTCRTSCCQVGECTCPLPP